MRLAYQLLLQSPDECLRRLPVIVMEDGLAHPRLPFLVWLMIAHTKGRHAHHTHSRTIAQSITRARSHARNLWDVHAGWSLGLQHVLDVMQVVYELAACEWRDTIPSRRASRANPFLTHVRVPSNDTTRHDTTRHTTHDRTRV